MHDLPAADFNALLMHAQRESHEGTGNEWRVETVSGVAPAIGVSEQEIQPQGGITATPTTAGTLTLVSDDPNDTFGGTGLNAVLFRGLDSDFGNGSMGIQFPYYEEVILMAGLTPVTASISILHAQQLIAAFAGTLGTSAGTVTADVDGVVQLILRPRDGTSKSLRLRQPRGWIGYTERFEQLWSGNNPINVDCQLFAPDGTLQGNIAGSTNLHNTGFNLGPNPIPEAYLVRCLGTRSAGGGTDAFEMAIPVVEHRIAS